MEKQIQLIQALTERPGITVSTRMVGINDRTVLAYDVTVAGVLTQEEYDEQWALIDRIGAPYGMQHYGGVIDYEHNCTVFTISEAWGRKKLAR